MRITTKVAAAGSSGLSRFPVASFPIDDCLDEDGRLDESKARDALNIEQVTWSNRDDRRTCAFALEYLRQVRAVVEHMAENKDSGAEVRTDAETTGDRHCERNMKRGRFAYVRTDITPTAEGLCVRLSCANPKEVVGAAECFAREYAVMCARILRYIVTEITLRNEGREYVRLVGGSGCEDIFEEAELADARDDARKAAEVINATREKCQHRKAGYCSPTHPDCACYDCGRCRAVAVRDDATVEDCRALVLSVGAAVAQAKREANGGAA